MASNALKNSATMLLMPGVLIGVHGLIYVMGAVIVGLMSLGFGGLLLAAAASDGTSEGWMAAGFVSALGGMGTLLMFVIAAVHLVLGGLVIRTSVHGLKGRGSRSGLVVWAVISGVFSACWTLMALLALNPFVIFWMIATVLAAVAGGLAVLEEA